MKPSRPRCPPLALEPRPRGSRRRETEPRIRWIAVQQAESHGGLYQGLLNSLPHCGRATGRPAPSGSRVARQLRRENAAVAGARSGESGDSPSDARSSYWQAAERIARLSCADPAKRVVDAAAAARPGPARAARADRMRWCRCRPRDARPGRGVDAQLAYLAAGARTDALRAVRRMVPGCVLHVPHARGLRRVAAGGRRSASTLGPGPQVATLHLELEDQGERLWSPTNIGPRCSPLLQCRRSHRLCSGRSSVRPARPLLSAG